MKEEEYKNCWKCGKTVRLNDYGYSICYGTHQDRERAIVFTDKHSGYKVIQRDGSEVWR